MRAWKTFTFLELSEISHSFVRRSNIKVDERHTGLATIQGTTARKHTPMNTTPGDDISRSRTEDPIIEWGVEDDDPPEVAPLEVLGLLSHFNNLARAPVRTCGDTSVTLLSPAYYVELPPMVWYLMGRKAQRARNKFQQNCSNHCSKMVEITKISPNRGITPMPDAGAAAVFAGGGITTCPYPNPGCHTPLMRPTTSRTSHGVPETTIPPQKKRPAGVNISKRET